jgi:hypothetical protein
MTDAEIVDLVAQQVAGCVNWILAGLGVIVTTITLLARFIFKHLNDDRKHVSNGYNVSEIEKIRDIHRMRVDAIEQRVDSIENRNTEDHRALMAGQGEITKVSGALHAVETVALAELLKEIHELRIEMVKIRAESTDKKEKP